MLIQRLTCGHFMLNMGSCGNEVTPTNLLQEVCDALARWKRESHGVEEWHHALPRPKEHNVPCSPTLSFKMLRLLGIIGSLGLTPFMRKAVQLDT